MIVLLLAVANLVIGAIQLLRHRSPSYVQAMLLALSVSALLMTNAVAALWLPETDLLREMALLLLASLCALGIQFIGLAFAHEVRAEVRSAREDRKRRERMAK